MTLDTSLANGYGFDSVFLNNRMVSLNFKLGSDDWKNIR